MIGGPRGGRKGVFENLVELMCAFAGGEDEHAPALIDRLIGFKPLIDAFLYFRIQPIVSSRLSVSAGYVGRHSDKVKSYP